MMDTTQKNGRFLLICLLLALVTLAVFWQVKDHEFINYDDNLYVSENPHVQAGLTFPGIKWAFTTSQAANWHPLTWLSHMLDCQLFGLKPAGHHAMNLFFHIANALLLFFVLHRMTKALWQSAFVAALFALHPLHVESVAWVAERKDVLSTFFWMLTMGAYVHYVERPDIRRYFMVLLFFVLGLLAKPMLVTLPFVLLLLDYWPLGRFQPAEPRAADAPPAPAQKNPGRKKWKNAKAYAEDATLNGKAGVLYQWLVLRFPVREKVPFFVFSVISSIITVYHQQKGGALFSLQALPLDSRMGNALISYVSYVGKMIWPQNLAVFYPHPVAPPVWHVFGAVLVLVTITILAIGGAKRFPYCVVGWFWFLGTLVPVIGLMQVGLQAMADRYTYVPFVGLFIMIAWGVPELMKKWPYRKITLAASAGVILFAFIIVTRIQLQYWQDSITLFRHALSVTTDNNIAHTYLGTALSKKGDVEEAMSHYREAIRINPNYGEAHADMGNVFFMRGEMREAEFQLREALRIEPNDATLHYNMGMIMLSQSRIDEAIYSLREALHIKPNFPEAHFNLGNILASHGMISEAITHYAELIRLNPNDGKAHNNMGNALLAQGKIDDAIAHFQLALRIEPDLTLARDNLRDALKLRRKEQ